MVNEDHPNKARRNICVQMYAIVTFAYSFLLNRLNRALIFMILKFSKRGIETEISGLNGPLLKHHPKAAVERRAVKVLCCCPVCQWPLRAGNECTSRRNKDIVGVCLARPAKEAVSQW